MRARYGTRPADILAAIGPSIAAHHYEVGREVAEQVKRAFGSDAPALLPEINGSVHLDLWAANIFQLQRRGVRNIELSGICTACNTNDWFSHRAENGHTGRFGALIVAKPI
jgi:copper oxidase (laccase) domain-containing protein